MPGGGSRVRGLACALLVGALGASGVHAAPPAVPRDHAIPGCYEQWPERLPRPAGGADLLVVIDQTTPLDARMQQIVGETVQRLLRPGTTVSVLSFSAFLPGRYLDVLVSGRIEGQVTGRARDYVPKRLLLQTDQCLEEQMGFARRLMSTTLERAFRAADSGLARSDILAALRDISRRAGATPADERLVLIVSDMLENSSITSFYRAGQLRRVDPEAELALSARAGIQADFRGARVFVIGAGLGLARQGSGAQSLAYRDPRAMLALEEFWRLWFAAHKAELIEFGKPTPLVEIRWAAGNGAGSAAR